jgi:chitin synthase
LAALQFGTRKEPENHDKFVVMLVPCYTEGAESLMKTMESLATTKYDDKRKLLFIIADGMVSLSKGKVKAHINSLYST